MKVDDIIGKQIGMLSVIKEVEPHITPNGTKQRMVLCRCSCGNEKCINAYSITSGETTSCGCYQKSIAGKYRFVDLTGQTINGIYVESRVEDDIVSRKEWNCICFCSNRFTANGYKLRTGVTRSCGCIEHELKSRSKQTITPGMVFDDYEVESLDHVNKHGVYYWLCRCTICNDRRVFAKTKLKKDVPLKCNKHIQKEIPDIVGQTYDFMFVDSYANRCDDYGRDLWNCTCLLCGGKKERTFSQLKDSESKSCGCLRGIVAGNRSFVDLTGKTINDIFVIRLLGTNKRNNCIWECKCLICGNIFTDTTTRILNIRKNCGCTRTENLRQAKFKDLAGQTINSIYVKSFAGYKDSRAMWNCVCGECSREFIKSAHELLSGKCYSCGCLKSSGEREIQKILDKYNIAYEFQKTFIGCKNEAKLRFDVWVPAYGVCIEYDGEQHFSVVSNWNDTDEKFHQRQQNDAIKTKYCEENDIILLRIPYWEKDNIESILSDWLFLNDAEEANSSDVDLSA